MSNCYSIDHIAEDPIHTDISLSEQTVVQEKLEEFLSDQSVVSVNVVERSLDNQWDPRIGKSAKLGSSKPSTVTDSWPRIESQTLILPHLFS